MKAITGIRSPSILPSVLFLVCCCLAASLPAAAQTAPVPDAAPTNTPAATPIPGAVPAVPAQPAVAPQNDADAEAAARRELAHKQIKQQEHQRVLGVLPEFNISNISDAVPLTAKQKFELAFKSATDPATFLVTAFTAGINQAEDSYRGYGQGVKGFSKYWGASYADTFDGTMLGNALFPSLLREDPRYFRKGTGSFGSRLWYSVLTTVRAKTDKGNWGPNFGNVLGNIAAGGISNLYYPAEDRGVGLTFQRAFVVTAEGAFGALFYEFWPDILHKVHKKKTP